MICNNCKKEIPNDSTFCCNCGEMISEENKLLIPQNNDDVVKPLKEKAKREYANFLGIEIPVAIFSAFFLILAYAGYITPLLLLMGVLLLAKVENKTLMNNAITFVAIYLAQLCVEVCITFVASIPSTILNGLCEIGKNNIDFITTISNISAGFSNVFGIITTVVSYVFLAIYILCIISLFRSDKVKISFIDDWIKKISDKFDKK